MVRAVSAPKDKKPALVEDPDEIYSAMLGPTLKQLQDKAGQGTLSGGDIAGYLALVKAFSETNDKVPVEYLGSRPLAIAAEVLPLIADKLVGLKAWSQLENEGRKRAAQARNEMLQDMANARHDPAVDASTIATNFLEDTTLHDLLQLWDPELKDYRLMAHRTLRDIIGKRGKRK